MKKHEQRHHAQHRARMVNQNSFDRWFDAIFCDRRGYAKKQRAKDFFAGIGSWVVSRSLIALYGPASEASISATPGGFNVDIPEMRPVVTENETIMAARSVVSLKRRQQELEKVISPPRAVSGLNVPVKRISQQFIDRQVEKSVERMVAGICDNPGLLLYAEGAPSDGGLAFAESIAKMAPPEGEC